MSRAVDVPRKVNAGGGNDVTQEGELGDASVLDLVVMKAVDSLLVGTIEQAKRIEVAKQGPDSELRLEGIGRRGGLGHRSGGKCGGGSH